MRFAIDSDGFPANRRLDSWRGILCDTYVGLDTGFADETFRSVINGHALGDFGFTQVTASSPYHVDRSRTLIKRDSQEVLFFGFALSGRFVMTQGGREALVEPGVIAFNDATRPFRTHFGESVEMGWVAVPKKALAGRVEHFEDLTAMAFGPTTPVQQITFDFLSGLGAVLDRGVPEADVDQLFKQAIDLLVMTMAADTSRPAARAALHAARRRRLRTYLNDHLHHHDLSRKSVAAALSMSLLEIDAMFDDENTSFDNHLLERRLDGCRTFLESFGFSNLSISDIAKLWGFTNPTSFEAAFHGRFGVMPQDVIDAGPGASKA